MSHLFFLIALLMFAGAILRGSTPPAQVPALPPNAPFERVKVAAPIIRSGETQNLSVALRGASGQATILTLELVYPTGATERIIHSTMGSEATISWNVPADAGTGIATFRLSKGDCGCGDRSLRTQNVLPAGMIEGTFMIE